MASTYEPGGRWALYANCSIARLVRSIVVRRLRTERKTRALTVGSHNTDRRHLLIDGQVHTKM